MPKVSVRLACQWPPPSVRGKSFEDILITLDVMTHRPPGQTLTAEELEVAECFEPRTAWAREFLREIRIRRWGHPYDPDLDSVDDSRDWKYPIAQVRRAGERGKRLIERLLFDTWRGSGRPRAAHRLTPSRDQTAKLRQDLLQEVRDLFRATREDRVRRRAPLSALVERCSGRPPEPAVLNSLLRQYPSRIAIRLLTWTLQRTVA